MGVCRINSQSQRFTNGWSLHSSIHMVASDIRIWGPFVAGAFANNLTRHGHMLLRTWLASCAHTIFPLLLTIYKEGHLYITATWLCPKGDRYIEVPLYIHLSFPDRDRVRRHWNLKAVMTTYRNYTTISYITLVPAVARPVGSPSYVILVGKWR